MRHSIVAWLLLGLAAPAAAQAPEIEAIRILEFGIYRETLLTTEVDRSSAMGHYRIVADVELIEPTDTVCARLGLSFGFTYVLDGRPAGEIVPIQMITRFPPPGVTNPSGQRFLQNDRHRPLEIGAFSFRSYTFEAAWEMVPGRWAFEFHHQGRKIGEKVFTVLAACPMV